MKIILIGGGTFLVGKILGPLFSKFAGEPLAIKSPEPFRIVEDEQNFSVFDESGEEVFQIDKGV